MRAPKEKMRALRVRDLANLVERLGALAVLERQGDPGHAAKVLLELRLVAVRRAKDHLKVLARGLELRVGLGELRGEVSAGPAPVRRKIDADILALNRLIFAISHKGLAQRFQWGRRRPWILFALWIFGDSRPAICGNQFARLGV